MRKWKHIKFLTVIFISKHYDCVNGFNDENDNHTTVTYHHNKETIDWSKRNEYMVVICHKNEILIIFV